MSSVETEATFEVPADLAGKMKRWVDLTEQKRVLEASLRKLADELSSLEPCVLEDLALAGMTSATVNGMTVYQQREFFAGLKEGVDKQEALRSFLDEGHADLVMLGWQGLRALVREAKEGGGELPPCVEKFCEHGDKIRLRARKA